MDNNPRVNSNSPIHTGNISYPPSPGHSSPPFIPSQDDWPNLQEIMDKDYPTEHTASTSTSQYPPTISEDDWQDIESIINNSESTSSPKPPSPKLYTDYTSVFSFNDITLEQPYTSDIEQPSTSSNNNTALQSNPTSNSPIHIISNDEDTDDEDTDDEERTLTSDDIFNLMCYISDCKNNETKIDISIFKHINIPTLPRLHSINTFNGSIDKINLQNSKTNIKVYAGNVNSLSTSVKLICIHIQEHHPNIYPAKQILELIRSSPYDLKCISILHHEEKLKPELTKIKWKINSYNRYTNITTSIRSKRSDEMKNLVSAVENKFKDIYNLE
ncbi:MAG: hypothetical protein KFW09_04780 [Oscillospiraceae bacterium]|nr:hypothetical protein [Oscillospiraceae bacterium]